MKYYLGAVLTLVFIAVYSCGKQRSVPIAESNNISFDFSQFYHIHETNECIFDAHRNVPLGKKVAINSLDSLFGVPIVCDTVMQTANGWSLYEQECQAAAFMPTEIGDTLVMMRRIYGRDGDWLIWIDLELHDRDSLRVLNFIAYDNSRIEI